ncbi:RagB/SusD family nutrient uptake outer membrane protein [Sphingobacterium sp. E70]|uniref:RagB/SusD family nutrient uptake outer membrane protein n=1 Tax=Sphingobacterium sp. E70 TaxID=2853439 RepID=UPI00211C4B76|nr:RagB/SusD family nutrient uptake outer membrane protein [Sphingobacterium sp. E70]ULT22582.1 RagB/SusD family nutrient uptake outer membrane protein [Sphingobacterium sp. E70]
MKKNRTNYKWILCIACALSTTLSCSDKLDLTSPDKLTSDNFWRNAEDAESGLSAAYSQLEAATDVWEFAEVKFPVEAYREDACEIGSDALNYQTWVELYNFTYTNGNSQFTAYWSKAYRGISYANQVIEKTAPIEMDANKKNQIIAEAKFLRAYYHLKLLLNWEKIVIRDQYITNEGKINKALSTRDEAWAFIIGDLEAAVGNLPVKQEAANVGRATRGAANAYLGYSYLTSAYENTAKKRNCSEKLNRPLKPYQGIIWKKISCLCLTEPIKIAQNLFLNFNLLIIPLMVRVTAQHCISGSL